MRQVVATDLSAGMVRQGLDLNRKVTAPARPVPFTQCDAVELPFADASFDTVFTAYGAVPFVADTSRLMREVARVLRPGGRFVFSTTHPFRWAFPDDPGAGGLTITQSYFDRTPYVEADADGEATYVEHHRTRGRPRPRAGRCRPGPRRPRRAGVAGAQPAAVGRLVAAAGRLLPRDRDLRLRPRLTRQARWGSSPAPMRSASNSTARLRPAVLSSWP